MADVDPRAMHDDESSAVSRVQGALARIDWTANRLGAVTRTLSHRALQQARQVDWAHAAGLAIGPLAGMPFVAKDLFDVAGLPNTAGAELRAASPPALCDASLIARWESAGAILIGTANMDEFAYGFVTQNAWTGTARNPHDHARLAGGSSGGCAAAVAAGLVPIALGSDTNGSVRVPASLCGIYGLKPTHGTLSVDGMFPFAETFDDPGLFAATLADMRTVWRVSAGIADDPDPSDGSHLRAARLGGWFARGSPDVEHAAAAVCAAMSLPSVEWPDAEAARSGAFLMTAAEGGALHRATLETDAERFDPAVRDRLYAGALVPPQDYTDAHYLMGWMRARLDALFGDYDILVSPTTPDTAPLIADPVVRTADGNQAARSHLGIFTQPITFLGLPALSVPLSRSGSLPLGLQLIARPRREADLFAFAARLERAGLTGVSPPCSGIEAG